MAAFDFPTGTDTETTCALPGATANTANCNYRLRDDVTDVGSYTGSPSPYGTFDQGGNMWEYTGKQRPPFAHDPGPGQESVWDYPRPPALEH